MASKSEVVDIESVQKRSARRGRCLDGFLVFSVIVLFAGLASLASAGFLVVQNIQSQLKHLQPQFEPETSKQTGAQPEPTYKMENFAYLEATQSELNNHTMKWSGVTVLSRKPVGTNFVFNRVQHWLQVREAGVYFLYLNLNLTCGGRCEPGHFRITAADGQGSDKLRCDVNLPQCTSEQPQQRKCWTVTTLEANTTLQFKMSLPHGRLSHWRLELEHEDSRGGGSGFGLFMVGH